MLPQEEGKGGGGLGGDVVQDGDIIPVDMAEELMAGNICSTALRLDKSGYTWE